MGLKESLRIMVVDDMATSRGLITQALDDIGIKNYVTENDGNRALERLASTPVHLVLSDFNMPGLDGLGLLKGGSYCAGYSEIGVYSRYWSSDTGDRERGKTFGAQ